MSAKKSTGLRLMPTVMLAAGALLGLKAIELVTQSSYLFSSPAVAASSAPKAEAKPALPEGHGSAEGSGPPTVRPAENPPVDARGDLTAPSSSQPALIEALAKRREAIEARAAELADREQLLKAAEKRLEDRLSELKRLENSIAEADKRKADLEGGKLKELVVMYENMKPKEAARIFEKLDGGVLLDVASRMKPRQLSVVLGLMAPDAAQRLTVSLARREVAPKVADALETAELPKIEGRPTGK